MTASFALVEKVYNRCKRIGFPSVSPQRLAKCGRSLHFADMYSRCTYIYAKIRLVYPAYFVFFLYPKKAACRDSAIIDFEFSSCL